MGMTEKRSKNRLLGSIQLHRMMLRMEGSTATKPKNYSSLSRTCRANDNATNYKIDELRSSFAALRQREAAPSSLVGQTWPAIGSGRAVILGA
jgi:hypothetical protein